MFRVTLLGLAFVGCGASLQAGDDTAARFALLVGISEYPNLSPAEQLTGSENDVRLMQRVLRERFAFTDAEIRILTGKAATGEAIRGELAAIAEAVSQLPPQCTPADVVFHFSGHGSQIADQQGDGRDEVDGLDETLVPVDATKQGGDEDIRDDELNAIAHQICEGGRARLWIVLDCCHSGTGTRAVGATGASAWGRYRSLRRQVQPTTTPLPAITNTLPEHAIALYACRDQELEPEYHDGDQVYGLLTRFLAQVLLERYESTQLSYASLRDAIEARYRQDRRIGLSAPVPQLEGSAALLDSPVLGADELERKHCWEVRGNTTRSSMLAGAFHGITVGSIFELYTSPETVIWEGDASEGRLNGQSQGFLKVTHVEAASSTVELVQWQGEDWHRQRWPRGLTHGYAVLRIRENGDYGLTCSVVQAAALDRALQVDDEAFPPAVRETLGLKETVGNGEVDWLTLTSDMRRADVVLMYQDQQLAVFPGSGHCYWSDRSLRQTGQLDGGWGPIDLSNPEAAQDIRSLLRQVARARNLIRIASRDAAGGKHSIRIKLELLRVPSEKDFSVTEPWPLADADRQPGGYLMKTGDLYCYRITNETLTEVPVYITVLHVNADMGIEQVFPYQDATGIRGLTDCLLRPRETRIEGPFVCNGVGQRSYGLRRTVVLATTEPNHFYMLNQPSLSRAIRTRSLGNPSLGQLLFESTDFTTRSRRRPASLYDDSWGSAVLQWIVEPGEEQ